MIAVIVVTLGIGVAIAWALIPLFSGLNSSAASAALFAFGMKEYVRIIGYSQKVYGAVSVLRFVFGFLIGYNLLDVYRVNGFGWGSVVILLLIAAAFFLAKPLLCGLAYAVFYIYRKAGCRLF